MLVTVSPYRLRVADSVYDYMEVGMNGLLAGVKAQSVANELKKTVVLEVEMVDLDAPLDKYGRRDSFFVTEATYTP